MFSGNLPTFSGELFSRTESPLLNKDHAEVEICGKILLLFCGHPAGIYLLKVNNRNKVNFEHISHHVLVFLLLTLNM